MNANFPTTGGSGSASDIPPGTGYVHQDPPGTFTSLASIPGSDLDAGSVTNAKLQNSSIALTQPAAGLTVTSSVALGGSATFALTDDLAAVEALSTTGFAKRTGPSAWATQASISLATDVSGTLSGASITDYTIPNYKLEGGTVGRVMVDGGAGGQWLGAGTNNYLLRSNGGASLPAWTDTLTGINISGATNALSEILTSALSASFLLPVAKGGTNLTTPLTTGALLYASSTTVWSQLAAGTSGYVLTSNGAGVAPSWQAPSTATHSTSSLSSSPYNIVATDTYEDVGLSVTLPSAGTYRVWANLTEGVRVTLNPSGQITTKLYNSTDAADVASSERAGALATINSVPDIRTVSFEETLTVAASKTIKVYAKKNSGPTYSDAYLSSESRLGYVKYN